MNKELRVKLLDALELARSNNPLYMFISVSSVKQYFKMCEKMSFPAIAILQVDIKLYAACNIVRIVDSICVDDRLLKYVIECEVLPDVCSYTGDIWTSTSIDDLPVSADLSLGLAMKQSKEINDRLYRALSHLKCLAYFDEWSDDLYNQ